MGTLCYVMGGAELKDAIEQLPLGTRKHLNISYSPCLGCCNDSNEPPYVECNGKVIRRAHKSTLLRIIKEEIAHVI